MLSAVVRVLYGELPHEKLVQASFFSALLCFVVGIYWMMRSLKDSVFATVVGLEYQPMAKMLSLVVVTVMLFLYNKLVDVIPRHELFKVICGGYSAIFLCTAVMLKSTTYGLYGPDDLALPASPMRLLGWVHYFAIESYGSLVVSLFWQYTNSQVALKEAKAQYGLIVAGGQVGAISGCTLVVSSKKLGVAELYGAGGLLTLVSPVIVYFYLRRFPPSLAASGSSSSGGASAKRVAPGLFEGLRLLFKHPYVLGIFAVSALFEIIATILDYQMKVLGKAAHSSTADFASFMGLFGQATNSVSLVFSVVGTSFVIRSLGLRYTLMLFPVALMAVVCVVYYSPSMWVLFWVMVTIKGLSYALNNPSKEMLYMVTTDSIKFKAKSWIDVFGGRASKALGSVITNTFKKPVTALMLYGSLISFGIAAALLLITSALGRAFERLTATDQIIGMDAADGEETRALTDGEDDKEDEESPLQKN
uniref:ADP,ATP carrier protein n=1 Tax=Calcidiscus leptoporus TaxID=127549 RepID=A0A7S0IL69_9EUKA|mmetsp:Transcript_12379/g.28583  ORF Transcript_12379/g.28583 Transcript_12379/m.28583 type:complete len:476 (+) Transcript_12379:46-1473(+)